jgi:hypothetical protein
MHMTKPVACVLCAAALLGSAGAYADFQQAMQDYNAGRYDAAHGEFLALAELGDCSSQFNLGAMALKGQGGPRDSASGAGWLQAAAGNGCEQLVNKRLAALSAGMSSADASTAAAIVGHYGHEALRVQGVFDPDFSCADTLAPRLLSAPEPDYPQQAGQRQQALVITALTIGADGFARDPEVLLAVPEQRFAAAAIEAWLNSRFAPAMRNGHPVAYRLQTKQVFAVQGGGPLAQLEPLQQARSAAAAGDTQGEYLLGLAATFESSLGLTSARAAGMLLSAARAGGPQAQYWVGSQLRATAECHPRADGAIWLTHAAAGGDAAAEVLLSSELLRGTPTATQIGQARAALVQAAGSGSYYVRKHVVALLAASRLDELRDPHTALTLAQQLQGGEIQSDPEMFAAVAAAYASTGDFHAAVAQQQRAQQKALNLGWDTHALDAQLAAYRAGRPWRGDVFASP